MTRTRANVLVALCLVFLAAQTVLAMRTKSPTADEFSHHVASGYSYLKTGDFRMNPASPPLPRMMSAFPLLFIGAEAPLGHPSWQAGDSPEFARQFFYVKNDRADDFIFWSRVPNVIVSLLFGLAVFFWSRILLGDAAAVGAVALYSFCPDILAHSGLATADLPVAFFFFMTLAGFYFYLKAPTRKLLVATGIFAGLAFLSKFSAVLLFPILLLVALISGKERAVALPKTLAFLVVCLVTVWAGYFFEVKALLKNTPDAGKKAAVYQKIGGNGLLEFAEKTPVPLSTFSSAFTSMMITRVKGTNAYLMGRWSTKGWWYYYFIAFAIKNTIPFLVLGVLGLFWVRRLKIERLTAAVLLVPILSFFAVTLTDRSQAGIRYFLPMYPFFIVLGGAAFGMLWSHRQRAVKALALFLIAWHIAEAGWIFPHYLSYFNQFAGGPDEGYKFLRDSNLDWGQDLKGVAGLVKKEGYPEIALFYPWPADPGYYKIPYRALSPDEFKRPGRAVYVIAAHYLDNVEWTKDQAPTRRIGHSMFVYDLR